MRFIRDIIKELPPNVAIWTSNNSASGTIAELREGATRPKTFQKAITEGIVVRYGTFPQRQGTVSSLRRVIEALYPPRK